MTSKKLFFSILTLCLVLPLSAQLSAAAPLLQNRDVPRITPAEAHRLQQNESVTFIDTRQPGQWQSAKDKIPGAIRVTTYSQLSALKGTLPADSAIVTYCT